MSEDFEIKEEIVVGEDDAGDFIVKAITIGDPESMSKQLRAEGDDPFIGEDIVKPPFDPMMWALLLEKNTRLNRLVRTYARNIVGLGWEIVPHKDLTQEEIEKNQTAIDAEIKRISELFKHPNEEMPFVTVMNLVKIDEESTGNGYMEVVRNNGGEIEKMYHVPSVTVGIRKKERGFVQKRDSEKRYFKCFGDGRVLNAKTGEFEEATEEGIPLEDRASEIIHFKVYSPRSAFYGIPRHVSASPAIAGSRFAAERNMNFFHNDAVPRMAVMVSGGQLDVDSVAMIERFFKKKAKGQGNAHRVLILQAEPKTSGVMKENNTKIEMIPLTVGKTDDASFTKYREMNDEEVREAYGVGKLFLGTMDDVNRASAMTSRQITNEQEFEPERVDIEYTINERIVKEFDPQWTEFRFKRSRTAFKSDLAEPNFQLSRAGALTPNDIRQELGMPLYDVTKFPWAEKPIPIALQEMRIELAKLMAASKNNPANNKEMKDFYDLINAGFSDKEGETYEQSV